MSRSSGPDEAENVEREPDHFALRNPDNEPPVWLPDPDDGDGSPPADRPWARGRNRVLIASQETAARLAFADVDGVVDARGFAEATDFARETLLLDSHRIGECFTLVLCSVTWSSTRYHTYLSRLYRDVDVACRADARDGLAFLIRIPASLDPERVTGSGSATTSGTCEGWRGRRPVSHSSNGGAASRSISGAGDDGGGS